MYCIREGLRSWLIPPLCFSHYCVIPASPRADRAHKGASEEHGTGTDSTHNNDSGMSLHCCDVVGDLSQLGLTEPVSLEPKDCITTTLESAISVCVWSPDMHKHLSVYRNTIWQADTSDNQMYSALDCTSRCVKSDVCFSHYLRLHIECDVCLQSTEADYDSVPVEVYGLAMLKGMGWKAGEGIGRTFKQCVFSLIVSLHPQYPCYF
jgi:hypothetical protein